MINFKTQVIQKGLHFKNFSVPEGNAIVKIYFEERDIRKTEKGSLHIDVLAGKLLDLLDASLDAIQINRKNKKSELEKSLSTPKGKKKFADDIKKVNKVVKTELAKKDTTEFGEQLGKAIKDDKIS